MKRSNVPTWAATFATCWLVAGVPALLAQSAPQPQPQTEAPVASSHLDSISTQAIGWLQGLIRINTTNPPGNELAAANYVAAILKQEGIPSNVYQTAPGRGLLIARLSASAVPNPSRALLLVAHLDVVGVDKSKWKVDPFSAVIEGDSLYGRGALDDKGMVIANVAVMAALKRDHVRLDRDVILLAEGDEEEAGVYGMQVAVQKYWEKIAAGFALNEGGNVITKDGKVQYVGVQAAEKVPVDVTVTATGTSGHASVPLRNNSLEELSRAITKIAAYRTPLHLIPITDSYFEQLSEVVDPGMGKWMRALDMPERSDLAFEKLSQASPIWNAMMRDTIVPTMLKAGIRPNVVPSEAQATFDVRLLPGDSIGSLLAKLKEVVQDPDIQFQADTSIGEATPSSSTRSALYQAIEQAAHEEFPNAAVVPMMSTGATDSSFLRLRNVQAYGLVPFPLTQADILRIHGDNERISLPSFREGIHFLYRVVDDFAAAK